MAEEVKGLTAELYQAIIAIINERLKEIRLTKEDFGELKKAVEELTRAQIRTEERMAKLEEAVTGLAEAQARTEERVSKLEEAVARLAEAQARTEERVGELEGRVTRLEEAVAKLEEAVARLAEAQARTEERVSKLEEVVARLAEAQARTEEAVKKLAEAQTRFERTFEIRLGALGARWGIESEESFRRGMRAILEEVGFKAEQYLVYDSAGKVFGRPDQVELDVVVRDQEVILAEIKSAVSRADVAIFNRKVSFYEEREGKKAKRKILISPFVEEGAEKLASALGVEIYTHTDDIAKI